MGESLPLATIQDAVLDFLRGRKDAALFGAQAVNAYVDEARMTQDVDVLSIRGSEFAEEMRTFLADRFYIAVRVSSVAGGKGFRVYQLREPQNRHLVDVRPVQEFPPVQLINDVLVITPSELLANKLIAYVSRMDKPKSGTDWRDVATLLIKFPELKILNGTVSARLTALNASAAVQDVWREFVGRDLTVEGDEDEF